jgi:hypothetical protein
LETRAEASVSLIPSLTVSEEYNDNFFFKDNTDREEDLTTTITPALTLRYENPSIILGAHYRGGVPFHLKHKEEDGKYLQHLNFDIALPFLSRRFHGVDVRITEFSDFTPEIPAISLGGPPRETFGTGRGRVDTSRNMASIGLGYSGSPRWRTDLTYLNTLTQYKGETAPEDTKVHNIDLTETYKFSREIDLSVGYGGLITHFEGGRVSREQHGTVGGAHRFSPTFFARGSIGTSFIPKDKTKVKIGDIRFTKKVRRADFSMGYISRRVTEGIIIIPKEVSQTDLDAAVPVVEEMLLKWIVKTFPAGSDLDETIGFRAGLGKDGLCRAHLSNERKNSTGF